MKDSFSKEENMILHTFWIYILRASTKEELKEIVEPLLKEYHSTSYTLEECINACIEATGGNKFPYAFRRLLEFANSLQLSLKTLPNEILHTQQITSIIQTDLNINSETTKYIEGNRKVEKNTKYTYESIFKKSIFSSWDSIETLSGKSVDDVRQKLRKSPQLIEALPKIFIEKCKEQDFEFLLEYKYAFQCLAQNEFHQKFKGVQDLNLQIIYYLIKSLEKIDYIEIKFHLLRLVQDSFSYDQDLKLLVKLRKLFKKERKNICLTCGNPLKIIVLGIELIKRIMHTNSGLDYLCEEGKIELVNLGILIEDSIGDDIKKMYDICEDIDLSGRIVIQIMRSLEENLLLDNPSILSVTHHLWYSTQATTKDYGLISTLYILVTQRLILFNYLAKATIVKQRPYIFTFRIWKESPMTKYFSKAIFEFCFDCFMTFIFILVSGNRGKYINEGVKPQSYLFWLRFAQTIIWMHFYSPIHFLFEMIYFNRRNIRIDNLTNGLFSEIILFVIVFAATLLYYLPSHQHWETKFGFEYMLLLGILIFFKFILIILGMRYIKHIGFIILSLKLMLTDIFKYFLLFLLEIIAFSCFLSIVFPTSKSYGTFVSSLTVLCYTALSVSHSDDPFDFGHDPERYQQFLGDSILVLFIFSNVIIVANLIIAILTDAYEAGKSSSDLLFIHEVLKMLPKFQKSKQFSSITAAAFPLNILLFPFILLIHTLPIPHRITLNRILLHFEYIFVFIGLSLIFLIFQIIMVPIAYIIQGDILFQDFSTIAKKENEGKCKRVNKIGVRHAAWIIFGLPILIYYIFKDLVQFAKSMYMKKENIYDPMNVNEKTIELNRKCYISFDVLKIALYKFKNIKEKYLTEDQFKHHLMFKNLINKTEENNIQRRADEDPASVKLEKMFIKGFLRYKGEKKKLITVYTICSILDMLKITHLMKMKYGNQKLDLVQTNIRNILEIEGINNMFIKKKKMNILKNVKIQNKKLLKVIQKQNEGIENKLNVLTKKIEEFKDKNSI